MKALPSLRKDCLWVVALLLGGVVVASLGAQDPVEIIRQKPFQRATLAENWGEVEFPVTCVREETQQFFDQGLAQLHTHSYFEAERSFRRVIFTEPDCVSKREIVPKIGLLLHNRVIALPEVVTSLPSDAKKVDVLLSKSTDDLFSASDDTGVE